MKTLSDYIRDLEGVHLKGIRFVSSSSQETFMPYDSLYQASHNTMNSLLSRGLHPGDHLIIDIDQKHDFFVTFNACILAGIVPVPLATEDNRSFQKIINVARALNTPYLITDARKKDEYLKAPIFADKQDRVIVHDQAGDIRPHAFPSVNLDHVCFVQFSSGSTDSPKGVVLTHRNILTNVFDIAVSHSLCDDDIALSWMPHTHDMGLIGQYLVYIVHQTQQIHISPGTFIRKPNLYLQLLQKYDVTITCSPNFGLAWLVKNTKKSLFHEQSFSTLRIIINGAEPVSPDVLADFNTLFTGMGLREEAMNPSYGLAEASLGVTFSDYRLKYHGIQIQRDDYIHNNRVTVTAENCDSVSGNNLAMVSLGVPLPNVKLRILDDGDNVCRESQIGEIVIQGENVTCGYLDKKLSKILFIDSWLRTGDLGFLYKGELYFCGRKKDLICINGKNYFSSDLEHQIHRLGLVPTMGDIVISSALIDNQERLVVFIKTKRLDAPFINNLQHIISVLQTTTGETIRDCVPLRSIPKTTSGKLKRSELITRYLKGDYHSDIHQVNAALSRIQNQRTVESPRTDTERRLHSIWSKVLAVDPECLGVTDDFFSVGGTSILAVEMLGEIEEKFNTEYGHDILINTKTIREMAAYINSYKPVSRSAAVGNSRTPAVSRSETDIAVTGIGIRMPGVRDPEELWSFFNVGRSSIQRISPNRLHLLQDELGLISYLGELTQPDVLDYHQDRFKKNELDWIDPHQKLLLNCSHDALLDGKIDLSDELDVGVYIGASQSSFVESVLERIRNAETIPPGALVGTTLNTYAARISNLYDFRGPSMVFDTACSSAIVALNYALEDLKADRISSALVGGANLLLGSGIIRLFNAAGVMSRRGQCSVFGSEADGIVIGEGSVVIHLEKLSDARRKDKTIYAVIKACSINNNGKTLGIMAPRPEGQVAVMRESFTNSGISPDSIGYFEVHGTGTVLGDPIEINSLKKIFSEHAVNGKSCMLGSSKSNFGHLLAASGLIGLLRASLSLYNKEIAPCINVDRINQSIDIDNTPFEIPQQPCRWETSIKRRACVNSFGFGGTNAHVILEECE